MDRLQILSQEIKKYLLLFFLIVSGTIYNYNTFVQLYNTFVQYSEYIYMNSEIVSY